MSTAETMALECNLPFIALEGYRPDLAAVALVSQDLARKFCVLPLFVDGDRLYLAVADPDDLAAQDYLQQRSNLTIETVVAEKADLEAALNRIFLTQEQSAKVMTSLQGKPGDPGVGPKDAPIVRVEDAAAPAIQIGNYILSQAINLGASDIHLEAMHSRAFLRYRVDGVLHEFSAPPLQMYRAIVSRLKIISNLDVAERRLAQDGRASFEHNERQYDLRVSIIPNVHGEGVVIRVLDPQGMKKSLDQVGFEAGMLERYQRLIQSPHGILLVTGPTGSGKSTTLYATLQHIYTPRKKIITLEDPVEYMLDGVTQIAVQPAIGWTFASALRSVLRHDPDVIMLGEIRDAESAEIALRASMTGHLVFSTLHTNDSPSAVARLLEMGIPSYLLLSSLVGVMAQRLLRRLCPKCKQPAQLTSEEQNVLGCEAFEAYHPVGCPACNQLGYKGRVPVYELLELGPQVRALFARGSALTAEIREVARQECHFTNLRESAVQQVRHGLVSVEDVLALTVREGD